MDTRYALIFVNDNGQYQVTDCGVLPDAPDKFIHELLVKHNEKLNTMHVTKLLRAGISAGMPSSTVNDT